MSPTHDLLRLDRRDRVCTLTLNRPDKKNALSLELVEDLIEGKRAFSEKRPP